MHSTEQVAVRVSRLSRIGELMAAVRASPPRTLLDQPVTSVEDRVPDADVLVLRAPGARVVIRPSGTEPKLKAYLEVVRPPGPDVAGERERARASLRQLRAEVTTLVGEPSG